MCLGYDVWKRKSCDIWGIFFKVLVIVSLLYKLKWYFLFNNYKQFIFRKYLFFSLYYILITTEDMRTKFWCFAVQCVILMTRICRKFC